MNHHHTDLSALVKTIDSPEYKEARKRELHGQSLDERIRNYLKTCGQRGHQYRPGRDGYPTIKQLAAYLGCDPTTLSKLNTGRRKQIDFETMTTLAILSGVCPIIPFDEIPIEKRARLTDADRWCEEDPKRRGTLVEALMTGIASRQAN